MPSLPSRRQSVEPPVVPLADRAADNLHFIRQTMERAGSFTAVPGWGLVATGATAAVASLVASRQPDQLHWLGVWLAEAAVGIAVSMSALVWKARRNGESLRSGPGRKFFGAFLPACVAGALLTLALIQHGTWSVIPGTWLLCYGTAVLGAGAFSVRIVPLMGLAFMTLGAAALLSPVAWPDAWLALGFGGLHLAFGGLIARYHGG